MNLGLESISYQGTAFYLELVDFFRVHKTQKGSKKAFDRKKINKIIKKHTNLHSNVRIDKNEAPNAYVMIPALDLNHPLFSNSKNLIENNVDFWKKAKEAQEEERFLSGTIDPERAKVGGAFAEVKTNIWLTAGLMKSAFTPEEISAILLHEIGHMFTFLQFLGRMWTGNFVVSQAMQELRNQKAKKERIKILYEVKRHVETLEDIEELAEADDSTIHTVVVGNFTRSVRSEVRTHHYDQRAAEHLADQFAVRHGAGKALITGLDKIHKMYPSTQIHGSTTAHMLNEATKVAMSLLWIMAMPLTGGFTGFVAFVIIMGEIFQVKGQDIYDSARNRLMAAQRQMVAELKVLGSDEDDLERKRQILNDLKITQAIIDEMNDRKSLMMLLINLGRMHQINASNVQRELEAIQTNDLIRKAAELETLQ